MIGATIIGAIIMDEISEINSSFHVKYRTMGKVQVLFSRNSLQVLAKNVCVGVCGGRGNGSLFVEIQSTYCLYLQFAWECFN